MLETEVMGLTYLNTGMVVNRPGERTGRAPRFRRPFRGDLERRDKISNKCICNKSNDRIFRLNTQHLF